MRKRVSIPPLIKWTGSKRLQANNINAYFPEYERYFEPFLGSGALLFLNCAKEAIASDAYRTLIKLWIMIRDDVERVINSYDDHWNRLQKNLPDYFYQVRDHFNKNRDPLDLLFMTRTSVNGIVRFNRKGEFNNSFHLSRKGMLPDRFAKMAYQWSARIKNVKLRCNGYQEILQETKEGDFVYLDPPYAGNRQRYTTGISLTELFSCLQTLSSKGVKYALSFDGLRGEVDLRKPFPKHLYKERVLINSGNSAVKRVLDGKILPVKESLYLNYVCR